MKRCIFLSSDKYQPVIHRNERELFSVIKPLDYWLEPHSFYKISDLAFIVKLYINSYASPIDDMINDYILDLNRLLINEKTNTTSC